MKKSGKGEKMRFIVREKKWMQGMRGDGKETESLKVPRNRGGKDRRES